MRALIFGGVQEKNVADLSMTFDSGETFNGEAVALTVIVIDAETKEKETIDFVIPKELGAELLVNLLTDEQWDAVVSV